LKARKTRFRYLDGPIFVLLFSLRRGTTELTLRAIQHTLKLPEGFMRSGGVRIAVAVCAFACIGGAAWAGRGKALGSVSQANNSSVDNQTALAGADVYACDVLDTDSYGELRVQFHGSQIVLGTSSEAVLDGSPDSVHVIIVNGSTGFSSPSSAALIIDTPAGELHEASGGAYTGTVTVTGPNEIVVSAVRGDITLKAGEVLHSIPAGKAARITFDHAAYAGCRKPGYVPHAVNPGKIEFKLIAASAGVAAGYFVWQELTESETKPDEF
jgi:hypothetical protein